MPSITLRPVVLDFIGEGQPEAHDPYANNQFIDTRGLPAPATGDQATYILRRVEELSQPFGTRLDAKGDRAQVVLARRGN